MKTKWLDLLPPADKEADRRAFYANKAAADDEFDAAFPARIHGEPFHSRYVAGLLDRLTELERATDPQTADPINKDERAFSALCAVGDLIETVAGWAILHQVGLAMAGLEFVPRGPVSVRETDEYKSAKSAVDDHKHEQSGNIGFDTQLTNEQIRQVVINVLPPLLGSGNHGASRPFMKCVEAMRDINLGYPSSLTDVERDRASSTSYARKKLQLTAIGLIEYRKAKLQISEAAATREVALAYGGLSVSAIRKWRSEFERGAEPFGALALAREVHFARNAASYVVASLADPTDQRLSDLADRHDDRYGDKALRRAGAAYCGKAPAK